MFEERCKQYYEHMIFCLLQLGRGFVYSTKKNSKVNKPQMRMLGKIPGIILKKKTRG